MQLLIRIVDKVSDDPVKHLQLTKRGDVIAVKPDGDTWGVEELANPEWKIISVPDLSQAEAEAFLAPETPPLHRPGHPVRKRLFRVDVDLLERAGWQILAADLRALKIRKAPLVDPAVIGPPLDTIGPS